MDRASMIQGTKNAIESISIPLYQYSSAPWPRLLDVFGSFFIDLDVDQQGGEIKGAGACVAGIEEFHAAKALSQTGDGNR